MLSKFLGINKGDVVSVVGSGGKTTALTKLGSELRCSYKTLLTSTTKIGAHQIRDWDFRWIGTPVPDEMRRTNEKGLYYLMKESLSAEEKYLGFTPEELDRLSGSFDVVLSEADGSRGKLLKGWNDYEPVIAGTTTKILGLINLKLLGKNICGQIIHRPAEFCRLTGTVPGAKITYDTIRRIVISRNGLFKDSHKAQKNAGKILFINMVDNEEDRSLAEDFLQFMKTDLILFDAVIYGSLLEGSYKKFS